MNPVVKILMPNMNYSPEERSEVIRQAGRRSHFSGTSDNPSFWPVAGLGGRDQLTGASMDQLDRWAERALDADFIQAVLAE